MNTKKKFQHTDEAKQKIGNFNKGKILSGGTKQKISDSKKGKPMSELQKENYLNSRTIPVLQYSLSGEFIKEFRTIKEATLETNIKSIGDCLYGNQRRAGQYIWRFKNSTLPIIILPELQKPFIRICPECKITKIEYKEYKRMIHANNDNRICKSCKKKHPKNSIGKYSIKCSTPNCENLKFYERQRQLDNAIKTNAICQECLNKKLSEKYSNGGFHKNKTEEEKQNIYDKVTKSRIKYYEENPEELQKHMDKRAVYSKIYTVCGLKCQGNAEKNYIEYLFNNKFILPTKPKGIKTSLGFYFPDFEFEDRFIEIKSDYTYSLLFTTNQKQLEKIKEVSKLKPVEIIIFQKNKIISNYIFK